jgi:hypothetical protein
MLFWKFIWSKISGKEKKEEVAENVPKRLESPDTESSEDYSGDEDVKEKLKKAKAKANPWSLFLWNKVDASRFNVCLLDWLTIFLFWPSRIIPQHRNIFNIRSIMSTPAFK